MTAKKLLILILLTGFSSLKSQIGGSGVFQSLEVPLHARAMAWGGYILATPLSDIQFTSNNPGLLNKSLSGQYAASYGSLLPGISNGGAGYAFSKGNNNFSALLQYVDFGTMERKDAGGNSEGQMSANEMKIGLGYSKELNSQLVVGLQTGLVYSVLGPYVANGAFLSFGIHYQHKDSAWQMGLAVKNAGIMLNNYRNADKEPLPFNIQWGLSFKPIHMPFRFHFTLHDLQQWDITYNQYLKSNELDLNGQVVVSKPANFAEKCMRHFAFGGELVLGKHMGVLIGYNHQRRVEMGPDANKGMTGYSWGIRMKFAKYHITYSSASYFPSQNSNMFSLSLIPAFFR